MLWLGTNLAVNQRISARSLVVYVYQRVAVALPGRVLALVPGAVSSCFSREFHALVVARTRIAHACVGVARPLDHAIGFGHECRFLCKPPQPLFLRVFRCDRPPRAGLAFTFLQDVDDALPLFDG